MHILEEHLLFLPVVENHMIVFPPFLRAPCSTLFIALIVDAIKNTNPPSIKSPAIVRNLSLASNTAKQ